MHYKIQAAGVNIKVEKKRIKTMLYITRSVRVSLYSGSFKC